MDKNIEKGKPEPSFALLPDRRYFRELLRPWKLVTFGIGMAYLIYGALNYGISDWDLGVSFIIGSLTYLLAPWSVLAIYYSYKHRPPARPLRLAMAFLAAVFTIDWVYWLYHSAVGNKMLRWENFKISMALYFLCGIFWAYQGSLKDFKKELSAKNREN